MREVDLAILQIMEDIYLNLDRTQRPLTVGRRKQVHHEQVLFVLLFWRELLFRDRGRGARGGENHWGSTLLEQTRPLKAGEAKSGR